MMYSLQKLLSIISLLGLLNLTLINKGVCCVHLIVKILGHFVPFTLVMCHNFLNKLSDVYRELQVLSLLLLDDKNN